VKSILTLNFFGILLCLLLAFWAGLNLGRVLTRWKVESHESDDQGENGDNNEKVIY
jgi:hypothetical protein